MSSRSVRSRSPAGPAGHRPGQSAQTPPERRRRPVAVLPRRSAVARRRHADDTDARGARLSKSHEFVANTFGETARSFGPGAQREHAGRSAGLELVHQSHRPARHDHRRRAARPRSGRRSGRRDLAGDGPAGRGHHAEVHHPRCPRRHLLLKLDPASNPELPSSVELISTKLFHAIGYHVPQDFIVTFTSDRLTVAPGARIRNASGDRVPIRPADVERWLRRMPRRADGSIRALASLYVPGNGRRPIHVHRPALGRSQRSVSARAAP